MFSCAN
jgi:excisionase family DNA binding protein